MESNLDNMSLDNISNYDFEMLTLLELSKSIQEPILNIHDARKKIECSNPTLEDTAMFYASFMKVQKETRTNPEYIKNIKNLRIELGYE